MFLTRSGLRESSPSISSRMNDPDFGDGKSPAKI
jgi:hypothetical protein